jgi:hypothetical protein
LGIISLQALPQSLEEVYLRVVGALAPPAAEEERMATVEQSQSAAARGERDSGRSAATTCVMALIITRREVRDAFRDWRIIIPIVLLTLFFPLLMNFTAGRMLRFVSDYGAELVGTRLMPFLLLVVGFFPTSFSLVIALETFVGEKERRSLEPLLATAADQRPALSRQSGGCGRAAALRQLSGHRRLLGWAGHYGRVDAVLAAVHADAAADHHSGHRHGRGRGHRLQPDDQHAGGQPSGQLHHRADGAAAAVRSGGHVLGQLQPASGG